MTDKSYSRLRCSCVDVHTHVVPHDFPAYLGRHAQAPWPSMAAAQPCHRSVMISGKVYRTVSEQAWDPQVRQRDMQDTDVARQVLSPMPELLSYWLEPEDGAAMCRYLNECIAGMVHDHPEAFSGLGAVPLQDVNLAIQELHHLIEVLGLSGVEVGSNIQGVAIGDPRFLPFFEACAELGAAVFVHPLRPAGMDRLVGPPLYEQALAFPGEIGLAAMSLITGGTLAKLPRLRIALSHGGGSLQVLVPRLQQVWNTVPAVKEALAVSPAEAARLMYYDDLFYDAHPIEALVRLVGPTQVMVGTDYPFAIMDQQPARRVDSLSLDEATKDLLRRDNALRWLGLKT
jgi:aminocarboxymuconate-semialdehyde decarboxylase